MSVSPVAFRPALRLLDPNSGVVQIPPYELAVPFAARQNGVYLGSTRIKYVAEVFGPRLYADQHESVVLKGYRPTITLTFELLEYDPANLYAYGIGLIQQFYDLGLWQSQYTYGLQFNAFVDNGASLWRDVYPTSAWDPIPVQGKQTSPGASLTLELRCRNQFTGLGNYLWANRTW